MREVRSSRQELSGDAQYAIVQPEKVFSGGRCASSEDDGSGRSAMVVVVVVDQWRQIILIPTQA